MPDLDGCQIKAKQRGPRQSCFMPPGTIREGAKERWEDRMLTSTGHPRLRPAQSTMPICCDNKGQALVEFTLCFILLLVIAWIPADFGLMFYTGHLGQNAAREGARIAAADPAMSTQTGTCNLPCSSGSDLLQRIANRVANGIMSNVNTSVTLSSSGAVVTCDQQVQVQISQDYYPFFYKILRMMYFSVPDKVTLSRAVTMRYEHQC
jgi:type IV secretory pathway TrbD component